ncbi:hypothetical protein EF847_10045 [Actinobacteria bacterium YIM 96077]|uniref:Integral membrane protein n=1 Tax=Phytoactinopolyspora halophila TaxID=1981511 RepID=A0A329QLS9_9ACTN|nr:hypothetical protein EF847_10045 [Actinobacteria bacterium YIM 96077]RAW13300.1 hypothetical protein DPM12_13070 [Phytoactinopolyspora halophila]
MSSTVFPDFDGVGGSRDLAAIVGGLFTVGLVVAVLMLVISAVTWAVCSAAGNYQAAARARTGAWVSIGAAALTGAGVAWTNFLIDLGSTL